MKAILIITASLYILSSSSSVSGESGSGDGGGGGGGGSSSNSIEWQILTKQNFSSQIRLHPHLLLLITVPWSGESRSLMKELAHAVTRKQEKFGPLKLRFMYKSNERMLADALGAREGLTFLYYHHSLSYKYQGRLHTHNILSSIYYVMTLLPEELPFKPLNTPEALKAFLESTDKAVILLEFCGWTPILLDKRKNNATENAFGVQGSLFGSDSDGGTSRPLITREKKDQKGRQNEKISCAVEKKVSGISILGELSSVNESPPFLDTENTRPGVGLSCTVEEFHQFDSFFTKFIAVTREFFLPPERQRYGIVSERSLLSSLGVEDSGPWFALLNFAGCPGCLKVFKEVDDLNFFSQMHNTFVSELEDDGHNLEPALPGNKPSVLLFVDRSSESSVTGEKSREALDAYRHLAHNCQFSHQMGGKNNGHPTKFSTQASSRSPSRNPKLELSPTIQKFKVKDKVSIRIVKEGTHVILDNIASNSQGSSLHEIVAYFRQQKKESTLSSLAKELGFQLLSDDIDIKVENTLPSEAFQFNQLSPELPLESVVKSGDELGKDQSYVETISRVELEKISKTIDIRPSSQYNKEKTTYVGRDAQSMSLEPDIYPAGNEVASEDVKGLLMVEKGQEQFHVEGFKGAFFFSDGGYQLLRALTAGSKIPSMIIVDPISMQHFAYPEDGDFSNSSLSDFLDGFTNGSLIPYQRSESVLVSPKEAMRPPFVNLDFHEVDSIPSVTALSLSNLVRGLNQSDSQNSGHACKEDVLVLFSNRWCGFCLRMELVVREVYRALKGYKILKGAQRNVQLEFGSDNLKDDRLKLPLIYLMDCTLNECGSILNSVGQREVYPALMLFPAEQKYALAYEGGMAVTNVIKFIANHGSHSHHLIAEKGLIWTEVEKGDRNQNLFQTASADAVHVETPVAMDNYHEVLLMNGAPKQTFKYDHIRPRTSKDMHEATPHVVAGSILVATEKLLNVPSFGKSTILIVNADHNSGFQGLIINKLISWDSLHNLEEELELLKQAPLSFGGPIIKRGLPLVALARRFIKNEYPEVLPGYYFLDQFAIVHEIEGLRSGDQSITDYWFFLGYSKWGREQLFDEIAEGAWNITDNNMVQLDWPH